MSGTRHIKASDMCSLPSRRSQSKFHSKQNPEFNKDMRKKLVTSSWKIKVRWRKTQSW